MTDPNGMLGELRAAQQALDDFASEAIAAKLGTLASTFFAFFFLSTVTALIVRMIAR